MAGNGFGVLIEIFWVFPRLPFGKYCRERFYAFFGQPLSKQLYKPQTALNWFAEKFKLRYRSALYLSMYCRKNKWKRTTLITLK